MFDKRRRRERFVRGVRRVGNSLSRGELVDVSRKSIPSAIVAEPFCLTHVSACFVTTPGSMPAGSPERKVSP